MITEAFDNKTEELIKVSRSKDLIHVDACILTFSHEIFKYVLGNYECKKIGNFYSSNGAKSVYEFEYENRHFAFYMSCISAPLCVGEIESSPSVFNTDKFIMFGGAGCLNKEIARGKVMVPTEAYRDEGTSYHYAKATDYITIKNSEIVAKFMEKSALPYIKGKTWTTDAFFRETKGNFEKEKQMVAFLSRWKLPLFKLFVIFVVGTHIYFLHQVICWMLPNGQCVRSKIKRKTHNTIQGILKLPLS